MLLISYIYFNINYNGEIMTLEKMIEVLKELDSNSSKWTPSQRFANLYITNECKIAKLVGKLEEQDRIVKTISLYKIHMIIIKIINS